MKIQRLKIDNFRHLTGLEFDFKYQSGDKKGLPLEKICLIGQSAAGKTSVLELIKNAISSLTNVNNKFQSGELDFIEKSISYTYNKDGIKKDGLKDTLLTSPTHTNLLSTFESNVLYYFTSEILSPNNFNFFTKNPNSQIKEATTQPKITQAFNIPKTFGQLQSQQQTKEQKFQQIKNQKILEFNYQTNATIWEYILDEISVYREKLTQKGSELINKGLHQNYKLLEVEMENWKNENPNPSIELAEKCLDVILERLNLKVDLVDTSAYIPLKPIKQEKAIPSNALSTGTKQLILNALPLFKLDTHNAIILIDEPERSLYPDIQIDLMSYYQKMAPNAQFIIATHSPFIAASFEPEERFILYFNEEGSVQIRNGKSPIGDDPNDILKNDFGLIHLMNNMGISAYKRYLELKQELATETDINKKKKLLKEVVLLGDKYKF